MFIHVSLSLSRRTNLSCACIERETDFYFIHLYFIRCNYLTEKMQRKKSHCCNINYYMQYLFHWPNGIFPKQKRERKQPKKYVCFFFDNNFRWYFSHFHETHYKLEHEIKNLSNCNSMTEQKMLEKKWTIAVRSEVVFFLWIII